jgi:hypothetical protein
MAAVIWVEVLARSGEVLSRTRIDTDEARVGRAYDNDVVVNDPYVAPHHVRIFRAEDGALVAEDLGSVNGLYAEHGAKRMQRAPLATLPAIRIGRTILRIHDADQPVAPEKALTPPQAHAIWAAALCVGLTLLILLNNWLELTSELNWNRIVLPLLGLATGLAAWAGLWSAVSRLFFGQAQFALHLRVAATACIAIVLWDQLTETMSFALAWRAIVEYAGLGAWAILGATVYYHLRAIGPRHVNVVAGIFLTLIGTGAAMQYVSRYETRSQIGDRAALGELRPPALRARPLASAEDFFKGADETRARVDRARLKEPPAGVLITDTE